MRLEVATNLPSLQLLALTRKYPRSSRRSTGQGGCVGESIRTRTQIDVVNMPVRTQIIPVLFSGSRGKGTQGTASGCYGSTGCCRCVGESIRTRTPVHVVNVPVGAQIIPVLFSGSRGKGTQGTGWRCARTDCLI